MTCFDIWNKHMIVPRKPIVAWIGSWLTIQNKQNNPRYFEASDELRASVVPFSLYQAIPPMFHLLTFRSWLLIGQHLNGLISCLLVLYSQFSGRVQRARYRDNALRNAKNKLNFNPFRNIRPTESVAYYERCKHKNIPFRDWFKFLHSIFSGGFCWQTQSWLAFDKYFSVSTVKLTFALMIYCSLLATV